MHCGIRWAEMVWLAATRTVPISCCPTRPASRNVPFNSSSRRSPGRQLLSGFREHHFARRSVKQAYAGLMFQLFHAVAYR